MNHIEKQQGFTLIEVLIAVTIFTFGLLAVASMQLTSVKGNFAARNISEATTIGQAKVEEFFTFPYAHNDFISDLDGDGTLELEMDGDENNNGVVEDDDVHTQNVAQSNGFYVYRWIVHDNDVLNNTKTITVDAQYTREGQTRRARLIATKSDII